ncbi:hypothetical protein ACP70R_038828 [Stipagrostis hirtigluma subsp. patula]
MGGQRRPALRGNSPTARTQSPDQGSTASLTSRLN